MQKLYGMTAACALVLITCQIASASEGHSLPWGDFLLRVINGAIFVGIIWYAAGKLIKKFFTDRREGIVREMDDLAKRKAEAEASLAEVERRIADVEAECAKLLDEGRAQAERIKAAIVSEAEKQAAAVAAERRIEEQQESDSLARIPLEETLAPAGEGASVRERNDDNEGFFD